MLLDVGQFGCDGGLDFAVDFLRKEKVAISPGSVFGPGGKGMVRISLAADEATISEGINRLARFVQNESKEK
jgi:aspartate/methionine/tyrosine aminotransferase